MLWIWVKFWDCAYWFEFGVLFVFAVLNFYFWFCVLFVLIILVLDSVFVWFCFGCYVVGCCWLLCWEYNVAFVWLLAVCLCYLFVSVGFSLGWGDCLYVVDVIWGCLWLMIILFGCLRLLVWCDCGCNFWFEFIGLLGYVIVVLRGLSFSFVLVGIWLVCLCILFDL